MNKKYMLAFALVAMTGMVAASDGKQIVKIIFIPDRMIHFVAKG